MTTPTGILNTGYTIPVIGFATKNLTNENAESLVKAALSAGCRYIDTSPSNNNEKEIGKTTQKIINETNVKRENVFISSKHTADTENVATAVKRTLSYFNTDCLDMCMLQNHESVNYMKVWKEMESLKEEGLIRSIGVSNFREYQIERLIKECSVVPAMHQMDFTSVQDTHIKFCKQHGIVVSAYMPLRQKAISTKSLFDDRSIVREIATKHGKTTTQVTLRSHFQRGLVSVIEGLSPSQLQKNLQIFDFTLTSDEIDAISTLKKKRLQSTSGHGEFRLIDIIDEKPTKNHRFWRGQRIYSEASEG